MLQGKGQQQGQFLLITLDNYQHHAADAWHMPALEMGCQIWNQGYDSTKPIQWPSRS